MAKPQTINFWSSPKCAKAFWAQQELPPYQNLLKDTLDWASPQAGDRWLDLGCGGGSISRGIWERTNGTVAAIVGLDCAAANESAYEKLRENLHPHVSDLIQFVHHDFSTGLEVLTEGAFDHCVSGLSISYAESYDVIAGKWTTDAYNRLLAEVFRVLRPGGRFVFSVNVPSPSWSKVAWKSWPALRRAEHPLRSLKRSWRMLRYGRWLKHQARAGRFHYLPAEDVSRKLTAVGFVEISHRLSYCDQAFIFRAIKPTGQG
jgi:SAM-dependent methyltransferase